MKKTIWVCACIPLLFLCLFFAKPPFSSPDEFNHLYRAYGIQNGFITLKPIANGNSGALVDQALADAAQKGGAILTEKDKSANQNNINDLKNIHWANKDIPVNIANTSFYNPLIYIPQTLSFSISRALNMNFYNTYLLISIITFLTCIVILVVSYKIYPIPLFTLGVLLLPMSLFQVISPTIDGMSYMLAILAMSCFMRLLSSTADDKHLKYAILLSISIIICAGSRPNLIVLVLLPLWVFLHSKKRIDLWLFFITAFISLSWLILSVAITKDTVGGGRHPGFTNSDLIIYYLKNPIEMLSIIKNTIFDSNLLQFYSRSFIGVLGWLDAPIRKIAYVIFSLILIIFFSISVRQTLKAKIYSKNTVFIVFVALISCFLIFPALLVQWSAFPTDKIDGIQGRYFIIPSLVLGYAFPWVNQSISKKYKYALFIILLYSVFAVRQALLRHYAF